MVLLITMIWVVDGNDDKKRDDIDGNTDLVNSNDNRYMVIHCYGNKSIFDIHIAFKICICSYL